MDTYKKERLMDSCKNLRDILNEDASLSETPNVEEQANALDMILSELNGKVLHTDNDPVKSANELAKGRMHK